MFERDDRILTPLQFAVEEVEQLVLFDRAADAKAGLMTPLGRIDSVRGGVGRVQRTVAEKPVSRAVKKLVPLRVMVLTMPPEARPYSGRKLLVTT